VYLGNVTTASNGSAGRWYVRVQNGYELDELHNVQARTPTYKDTLWYDNTASPAQWKTASISTILGYTPLSGTGTTNYVSKWSSSTGLTNSLIFDNGTNVGIGTASPSYKLDISGTGRFTGLLGAEGDFYVGAAGSSQFDINTLSATLPNTLGFWRKFGNGNYTYLKEDEQGAAQHKWAFVRRDGFNQTRSFFQANSSIVNINLGWESPNSSNYDGSTLLINPKINITNALNTGTTIRGIYYNPTLTSLTNTKHIAFHSTSGDIILNNLKTSSSTSDSIAIFINDTLKKAPYPTGTGGGVPYTGATADVDLGVHILSAQGLRVTGTNGAGDIHLRHQASDATATGQSTSLFADANGDLKYKNAGNFYTTLKTSTNTADRTYTYPNATTTLIGASDTSVFQRKSIASYSLMANNTNATGNATAQTFRDTAGTYAGTITWNGTAPTTQTINAYQWQQTGKMVHLQLFGYYTNTGTACSSVTFTLPSDCPAPDISMFTSGALATLYQGIGALGTSNVVNTFTTTAYMRRNAANTGNELYLASASANYRRYQFDITYRAQ